MPNRILRDGINSSERVESLSLGAELFYRRLISVVDDYGRFYASPGTLRGACWPIRPEKVTDQEVSEWLSECASVSLVTLYSIGIGKFLQMNDFRQQVRSKSKFPEPVINCEANATQMLSTSRSRISETETETKADPVASVARTPLAINSNGNRRPGASSDRLDDWWDLWSSVRGTNHYTQAGHAWVAVVNRGNEDDCFACTRSYLASLDNPAKGYNPENFLFEQARDDFIARWPARKNPESRRRSAREELLADA